MIVFCRKCLKERSQWIMLKERTFRLGFQPKSRGRARYSSKRASHVPRRERRQEGKGQWEVPVIVLWVRSARVRWWALQLEIRWDRLLSPAPMGWVPRPWIDWGLGDVLEPEQAALLPVCQASHAPQARTCFGESMNTAAPWGCESWQESEAWEKPPAFEDPMWAGGKAISVWV